MNFAPIIQQYRLNLFSFIFIQNFMDPEIKNTANTTAVPPEKKAPKEHFLWEIVKFAVIALVIIVPVRMFVAEPFIVSGDSMDPTFATGQYLIVDQLSYHFEQPARGDVIIFRYPKDPSIFFIKRIIGLPGETVSINNGVITIYNTQHPEGSSTGITLSEPYIAADHRSYDTSTTTLGPTQYFVMGDNRNQSSDSRVWGPVDRSLIIGRPIVRLLPPSSLAVLPGRDTALGK
jgi:signal peptidase I